MVFVYVIEVGGVPRYYGKGQGRRLTRHLSCLTGGPARERIHRLMVEAQAAGLVVTGRKLAEDLTEHQARVLEDRLVREGSGLWNIAPGGGGCSTAMASKGWACPDKREARRAAMNTPEAKAAKSAAARARWADPAYRERIAAARRASWAAGAYASRPNKGFAHINTSPELRERQVEARRAQARGVA